MPTSSFAFYADEMESTIQFYCQDVGLEQREVSDDKDTRHVRLGRNGNLELSIYQRKNEDTPSYRSRIGSERNDVDPREPIEVGKAPHFAVSVDDIDQAFDDIVKQAGNPRLTDVLTTKFEDKLTTKSFFTADPNGRVVAIINVDGPDDYSGVRPTGLKSPKLDHGAIWVSDIDAALDFFVSTLGLEKDWTMDLSQEENLESDLEQTGGRVDEFILAEGDFRFQLMADPTDSFPPYPADFRHIDIPVANVEEIVERASGRSDCKLLQEPSTATIRGAEYRIAPFEYVDTHKIRLLQEL